MVNDAEKDDIAAKPSKRTTVLMAAFIAIFLIIIIASLSVVLFLNAKKPAKPKNFIIYGDTDDPAICAATRPDLEKALELSKDWATHTLLGKQDPGIEKINELTELISSGRIGSIYSETPCILMKSQGSMCQVQITEGLMRGQNYWVYKEALAPVQEKKVTVEYALGYMCFRYVITALICASCLYLLRIKSIILQIIGFIVGMYIINLIWVKIAMTLIFR